MADKIKIDVPIKGYNTSVDAYNTDNSKRVIKAGEYTVTGEANGMVQLTTGDGFSVYWVNPNENAEKASKNNTNQETKTKQVDPSNTGTTSGYFTPSAGTGTGGGGKTGSNPKFMDPGVDAVECYIINLITGSRIEFYLPDELSDNYSAQFDPVEIRGRSTPLQGYDSSGPRQISLNFTLHDDYCKEGLYTTVCKLKALVFPLYTSYAVPPACMIKVGKAVSGKFIIGSVGVSYEKPYRDGFYVKAEISLDATEVDPPRSATDIESGGGMG